MADVKLRWEGEGRILVFEPQTKRGLRWLLDRVESEPYQWLGRNLVIKSNEAGPVIVAAIREGLEVN